MANDSGDGDIKKQEGGEKLRNDGSEKRPLPDLFHVHQRRWFALPMTTVLHASLICSNLRQNCWDFGWTTCSTGTLVFIHHISQVVHDINFGLSYYSCTFYLSLSYMKVTLFIHLFTLKSYTKYSVKYIIMAIQMQDYLN